MSSEFLPIYIHNALSDCEEVLPAMRSGQASFSEALAFCRNLRIAGIASLFLEGTPEELQRRLQQSGRAFAHYLDGAGDDSKETGHSVPFFDALAAGDTDGAKLIAQRARRTWAREDEYEEDFLFVEYLMQRFLLGAPPDVCERLLNRYEQALEGDDDPRLPVCRALQARDADAFNAALAAYLSKREDDYEARGDAEAAEVLATEALLSVEGLALARLAEAEGLATEADYLHVPSVAREGSAAGLPADGWTSFSS